MARLDRDFWAGAVPKPDARLGGAFALVGVWRLGGTPSLCGGGLSRSAGTTRED
jgi:hypothetical protein